MLCLSSWVDHLQAADAGGIAPVAENAFLMETLWSFVESKFFHWVEALSLLSNMSKGIRDSAELELLVVGETKFLGHDDLAM